MACGSKIDGPLDRWLHQQASNRNYVEWSDIDMWNDMLVSVRWTDERICLTWKQVLVLLYLECIAGVEHCGCAGARQMSWNEVPMCVVSGV